MSSNVKHLVVTSVINMLQSSSNYKFTATEGYSTIAYAVDIATEFCSEKRISDSCSNNNCVRVIRDALGYIVRILRVFYFIGC